MSDTGTYTIEAVPALTTKGLAEYFGRNNTPDFVAPISIRTAWIGRDLRVDPFGNIYVNEGRGVWRPYTADTLPGEYRHIVAAHLPRP